MDDLPQRPSAPVRHPTGTYPAAPPRRGSRLVAVTAVAGLAAIAAGVAVVLLVRAGDPPPPLTLTAAPTAATVDAALPPSPPPAAPAPAAVAERAPAQDFTAEVEYGAILARLEESRSEIERLEGELASARADVQRWQEGVEKCVAELNDTQRAHLRARAPPAPPSPSRAIQTNEGAYVHVPYVTQAFSGIRVAGDVYNPHAWEIRGTVVVEGVSTSTGRAISTERTRLVIPPNGRLSYDVELKAVASQDVRIDVTWDGD